LKEELKKELPGILAWAIRGCWRWQKDGLQFPESVRKATAEYRTESDQVGRFLAECCVTNEAPTTKTRASALYSSYQYWCDGNGEEKMSSTAFGRQLTERGTPKKNTAQGVFYVGLSLKAL
jgi:putative DNA primase/helicase